MGEIASVWKTAKEGVLGFPCGQKGLNFNEKPHNTIPSCLHIPGEAVFVGGGFAFCFDGDFMTTLIATSE